MDPSDDVLREIGRVALAATKLEYTVGLVLALLTEREIKDVMTATPGSVRRDTVKAARARLSQPLADEIAVYVVDARQILDERHAVVHSLGVRYRSPGGSVEPRHWIPRTDEYRLLDAAELLDLSQRIDAVTSRAYSGMLTRVAQAVGLFES